MVYCVVLFSQPIAEFSRRHFERLVITLAKIQKLGGVGTRLERVNNRDAAIMMVRPRGKRDEEIAP